VDRACHAVSSCCPGPTTMAGTSPMPRCGCGSAFLLVACSAVWKHVT
jgi:hypothetical protein